MIRPPLLLALLVALAPASAAAQIASSPPCPVVRVIDGDTVVVRLRGNPVTIRLIGVDAPESVHPFKPAERFGREASAHLHELLDGRSVRLEWEPATDFDRHGRTLAYLVRDDGLAVNRELVASGFAHAYTAFPFRRMEDFRSAEREARDAGLGLWGPDPPPAPAADALTVVHLARGGRHYHMAGCPALAKSDRAVPLAEVPAGVRPCKRCGHPVRGE